jgi:hypothetical protein
MAPAKLGRAALVALCPALMGMGWSTPLPVPPIERAAPDTGAATQAPEPSPVPEGPPPAPVRADGPDCTQPASSRPPDPRCGETLDGRPPIESKVTLPQAALTVPRLAARGVFWPIVKTSDFVEEHKLLPWMIALLTTDDGLIGVRPSVQYATGFLPTGGLRFFDRRLPGAGSELSAHLATGGPQAILAEALAQGPTWLGLSLRGSWNRRHDRLFAGIGPNTEEQLAARGQGLARYASDNAFAELRWSRALTAGLTLDLHTDLTRHDFSASSVTGGSSVAAVYGLSPAACAQVNLPSTCVDPNLLPRFDRGLRVAHGGVGLAFDRLTSVRDGSGYRVELDATFAQGLAGDPSQYVRISGEGIAGFGGRDRRMLFRLRGAMVEKLLYEPVPFDELVDPAVRQGLRGFPDGRLRGNSSAVATLEYRWFVAFNLDAALFVDAGTVAGQRFSGFHMDQIFPDFGFGLRRSHPEARYWVANTDDGIQVTYAPEAGVRLLLTVAPF